MSRNPDFPNVHLDQMPTEDGWDSYGAFATDSRAIEKARELLVHLCVMPSVNGGIGIEWEIGGLTILLDIEADGTVRLP